jgi:hypothetical protein
MQEARRAMAEQRQQQAAAEQIAREMSDEEITSSGRPWRWDGNQMQYTDTEAERVRLERQKRQVMEQDQVNAGRRARAARQEARNSAERAQLSGQGRAQPIPPQDTGTPYGAPAPGYGGWAGGIPEAMPRNIRDLDMDGIDDRMQPGPGMPMFPHWQRIGMQRASPGDMDAGRIRRQKRPKGFVDMGRIVG